MSRQRTVNRRLDAVVFDVDGVLTDTAELHRQAWTALFDGLDEPLDPPFSPVDYDRLVDGRPRADGLRAVLADRRRVGDDVDELAARKQRLYRALVDARGAAPYDDVEPCLGRLRADRFRLAAASASRNAGRNLALADLDDRFDVVIDGRDAAELGLAGKPAPDLFLEAARRLGTRPGACALVEDALAGLRAGAQGGFGLVIGIDRSGPGRPALADQADVVIRSLDELVPASMTGAR